MDVENPRRILCLGPPNSGVLTLLQDLTGTAPTPLALTQARPTSSDSDAEANSDLPDPRTTTAGLSHELPIRTKYYNADVPIWIDEVTSPGAWRADFASEEAGEVVKAVGAWIVVFRRGSTPDEDSSAPTTIRDADSSMTLLAAVKHVIDQAHGGEDIWDGACIAVGMPPITVGGKVNDKERTLQDWEDLCLEHGFEYIAGDDRTEGRSADGDMRGLARLKEALEANDWNGSGDENDLEDELDFDEIEGNARVSKGLWADSEDQGFALERLELEREFANLTTTTEEDDNATGTEEALQVEGLEKLMLKMQATKDMTAHLPLEQRRRVAAKAVSDLLKEL